MPDIDDDDALSDGELDIMDLLKAPGARVDIDMGSAVEVERANRLLQRGLIKVVGERRQVAGSGVWTLVSKVQPGETPPPYEALTAVSGDGAGG